uniref:hypothetical protein 16 n=1 Tax=Moniliophthora perniciosa TaxID=153609 RepID=UPI000024234E|nr:hypothetical protein 16 [Moniliophthora perniciosa]AAQ74306.1 hypothetical protein 16 [Moniliophthora perniciosa]
MLDLLGAFLLLTASKKWSLPSLPFSLLLSYPHCGCLLRMQKLKKQGKRFLFLLSLAPQPECGAMEGKKQKKQILFLAFPAAVKIRERKRKEKLKKQRFPPPVPAPSLR